MWTPEGKQIRQDSLGSIVPQEVLFEFEEPLTFVSIDLDGQLLLAHSLCAEGTLSRYVIAVTDQRIIQELKAGRLDILGALRQPRCWIADFGAKWEVVNLWLVPFEQIPKDHLPRSGAMISPGLDPIFRLRLIGPGVGPGNTTAADIRMAAQAAEAGLRGLARIALDEKKQVGQVPRTIRDYSDLPFQYTRAASFEIAFGRPLDRLPEVDDEVFDEMGRLLKKGLEALRTNAENIVPIEGMNETQATQLFEAIKALTPPMRGGVERIEVGGRLTDQLTISKFLTREDRLQLVERIKGSRKTPVMDAPFRVTGVAEGADKGFDFFVLRKLVPFEITAVGPASEIKFFFDDHLFDKVSDAWISEEPITVVGERIGNDFKALDIQEATHAPRASENVESE